MALREPLCACVREWGKERARASPPRFELHNQVLRSLLRTLRHWGYFNRTISFTIMGNNNTARVQTSEVRTIAAPLNHP
jgi:hypothetical protein